MPYRNKGFTLRIEREYIDKIAYIGKKESRNITKEIEHLIIQKINEYEAEFGKIILEEKEE